MFDLHAPTHTHPWDADQMGGSISPLTSQATQAVGARPELFGCFLLLPSDPSLKLKPALLFQVSSTW